MSKLSREQCENRLTELWLEIWEIYKQYNPNGTYLTACVSIQEGTTFATMWNAHYHTMSSDAIHPVNIFTRFEEGKENDTEQNN